MKKAWVALVVLLVGSIAASAVVTQHVVMALGGRRIVVDVAKASRSNINVGVVLAGDWVGSNAALSTIAKQGRALCAINGTFLAAYAGQTGEPYGTLNVAGQWLHLGSIGTRLDILKGGEMRLVRDDLRVLGSGGGSDKHPNNWYAYGFNQTPSNRNYAFVFTPERGPRLGFRADVAVVVQNGMVTSITAGDVAIPSRNGFVVALGGAEARQLSNRFAIGKSIDYRVESKSNQPTDHVQYSLGAGPRLLESGRVVLNPQGEGFTSGRVLTERGTFSMVGWNDTQVFFVVVSGASLEDGATVMQRLGALEAMRLDGGASSGLVCENKVLVRAGRVLANALVFWLRE